MKCIIVIVIPRKLILYDTLSSFPFSLPSLVTVGGYYKAIFSYDPQMQSPNTDGYEEELSFEENDIIQVWLKDVYTYTC